jgi:putative zinc finger/helix-turn-helix YgiT family protein
VYPAEVEYTTEIVHDGRPYTVTVPALRTPQCRNCKELILDTEASEQITEAFRRVANLLRPEEVRQNRERLGLTQAALAERLEVGAATLSRWETGAQIQQRSLDKLLRLYFALPEVRRALEPPGSAAPAAAEAAAPGSVPNEQEEQSHKVLCPECGTPNLETVQVEETFDHGGRKKPTHVTALIPIKHCRNCDFSFEDRETEKTKHRAACAQVGVQAPEEIRSIRKASGLSQREFARLTRLGGATLNRWERGHLIQNGAYDDYLYLLRFPENLERLKERRRFVATHPHGDESAGEDRSGQAGNREWGAIESLRGRNDDRCLVRKQGGTMTEQFREQRPSFLRQALKDAKKWCQAPETLVEGKRSDQFWLRLLSVEQVTADDAYCFLVSFQLTNRVTWQKDAVAEQINKFRGEDAPDIRTAVSELADALSGCTSEKRKRRTSAASKIAFFAKPRQEVYIWDQFARESAGFRNGRSAAFRDYASYSASCSKILAQERNMPDFLDSIQEFRSYLKQVGGPMGDSTIAPDSFIERRFLDKLMFWEGKWLKNMHDANA